MGYNIFTEIRRHKSPILALIKRTIFSCSRHQVHVWYCLLFKSIQMCYKRNQWRISQKLGLMKVFLQVKRLGNVFTGTCLNLKHTEKKYDNIRKHHGNGHSAPCPTPHCIKIFNILFKNLQIGMKIHIWNAKWFLTIQIRTIPYYWKSWLQYLVCPRIFKKSKEDT